MLAAVVALVVVAVVVLVIVLSGGSGSKGTTAAAGVSSLTPTADVLPPSQSAPSGGAAPGGADASQAKSAQDLQSRIPRVGEASTSGQPTVAAGLPTPGAVTAGGACPDTSISVVVTSDKPTYTLGDQPVFSATVTNAGAVSCIRDLGTGQQQLMVYTLDGTKRLWSNFDCTFQPQIKNELLNPGQQLTYGLQWAGTTSTPGCQTKRVPVPPGAYQVIAQLGEKRSAPVTFNITKPAPPPGG